MAAVTFTVILEPKKLKSFPVSIVSPSICGEVIGPDAMILVFWILHFKPAFSLYSLPFIKKPFSYSFSAMRLVSSAYLRLLIFLLAILIPAYESSYSAFCMIYYSAYKLKMCDDNIQLWHTSPIWNQSVILCLVLTAISWPAKRFLQRQVRWSVIPVSLRISHSLLSSTQRL